MASAAPPSPSVLEGKSCLVTGAARGIGKAITRSLLSRGAKVMMADVLCKAGEETAAEFEAGYGKGRVAFCRGDVSSHTSFEAAFHRCADAFAGSVDILVNNAGIGGEVEWETQLQINLMVNAKKNPTDTLIPKLAHVLSRVPFVAASWQRNSCQELEERARAARREASC